MNILAGVAIIITGAVLILTVKEVKPEMAIILTAAVSGVIIFYIIKYITPYINYFKTEFNNTGLNSVYIVTVLKAVGICYITDYAKGVCNDFALTGLAVKAELLGRTALIILSVPFIKEILNVALNIIK